MAYKLFANVFSPFEGRLERVLIDTFNTKSKALIAVEKVSIITMNDEETRLVPVHQVVQFDIEEET